ncbi:hypothetical protein JW710_01110 [Candidatus Dojkabacteria bacterium]|nr:hypothetical protein [Candidatus Dojkabacteria bacterium]
MAPKKLRIDFSENTIAKILTTIISPYVIAFLAIILLYELLIPHSFEDAIRWFGVSFGGYAVSIAILFFAIKIKYANNWDITTREKRPLIFSFLLIPMILICVLSRYWGYDMASTYMTAFTIGFGISIIVTLFWKISIHAYSAAIFTIILMDINRSPWTIILIILPILTGWSRIVLKKHTVAQVIGGILLVAWLYIFWLIVNYDITQGL